MISFLKQRQSKVAKTPRIKREFLLKGEKDEIGYYCYYRYHHQLNRMHERLHIFGWWIKISWQRNYLTGKDNIRGVSADGQTSVEVSFPTGRPPIALCPDPDDSPNSGEN